jgi:hypothetical protein
MSTVKVPPGSIYRQPSFRGRVYFSVINGRIVAKAWPRKAATKPTAAQIAARDRWKQLAQAAKRITPQELDWAIQTSGTSRFLWRDIYYMSLTGRLWSIPLKDEGTLYSMAQYADLSSLLDIASTVPGAVLYRGNTGWVALEPGTPGQVLAIDATGFPYWTVAPGGGGGIPSSTMYQLTADQAASSGEKTITWNSVLYDDGAIFDPANPSRIVIPPTATRWRMTLQGLLTNDATARVYQFFLRDQAGVQLPLPRPRPMFYRPQVTSGYINVRPNWSTGWFPVDGSTYYTLRYTETPASTNGPLIGTTLNFEYDLP